MPRFKVMMKMGVSNWLLDMTNSPRYGCPVEFGIVPEAARKI
jgi:hypothetical protein